MKFNRYEECQLSIERLSYFRIKSAQCIVKYLEMKCWSEHFSS